MRDSQAPEAVTFVLMLLICLSLPCARDYLLLVLPRFHIIGDRTVCTRADTEKVVNEEGYKVNVSCASDKSHQLAHTEIKPTGRVYVASCPFGMWYLSEDRNIHCDTPYWAERRN